MILDKMKQLKNFCVYNHSICLLIYQAVTLPRKDTCFAIHLVYPSNPEGPAESRKETNSCRLCFSAAIIKYPNFNSAPYLEIRVFGIVPSQNKILGGIGG